MNAQDIVNKLKAHKGQHTLAIWQRPCKALKSFDGNIIKTTQTHVRAGIDYSNLSSVKNAIASGARDEVEPLPWGKWKEFPFIIEHKGIDYLRLYPASFDNLTPKVIYTLNGIPTEYAEIEQYLLASEKQKKDEEKPVCFTIKADSLVSIGE